MICRDLSEWSARVRVRDNFQCKECGDSITIPLAHHIKDRLQFPRLSLDTDNGVTLCTTCHGLVHNGKPDRYIYLETDRTPRPCRECEILFIPYRNKQRFCSNKCRHISWLRDSEPTQVVDEEPIRGRIHPL